MSDNPGAARSLYPDHASALDPPAAKPESPPSDAARALYGNTPPSKPSDGTSPLGGQARPSTLLGHAPPGSKEEPAAPKAETTPFNPEMVKIEGMQADPALMGEFATAASELGLGHAGAERLLQLHAKTQREADAAMSRQSDAWQQETLAAIPKYEIQSVTSLVRDPTLTDPQLREWLETSPAGNWLPLVRTLANYANALAAARRRY